jgi:hypothetical protein
MNEIEAHLSQIIELAGTQQTVLYKPEILLH